MVKQITTKQFLQLYDELANPLFRFCLAWLHHRESALDVVQETFMRTWEYLMHGKEINQPRAFLYRTARNCMIDMTRRKREESIERLAEHGFDAAQDNSKQLQAHIDAKLVLILIDKLDEEYRDAVLLRYVADLYPREIAQVLGETENTISVRIHRGIERIRKLLPH